MQAKFRRKFNLNNYPQISQIYGWVHKFQATGSVNNLNKKAENPRSGRKLTARSSDNVNDAVRDSVRRSLTKSLPRCFQELDLSRASLQRILKKDLQLYLYKIQIKHKLTAGMKKHLVIYQWFENKIEEDPDFLDDVWFSDKAHFWLCGYINSNNCVYWSTEASNKEIQRPLHSVKCMASVAISKHGIIGLFWFENANEEAVTVTKEHYTDVLDKFWRALGTHHGMCNGSNKLGQLYIQPTLQWSSLTIDSLID